ncbi:KTSC domain-containing protein [Bradyrhizobium sp.]|uniref:KTSC domain-containing protein n=1 Tax=Bradyrhizobium sp. TaxID=376 RepID=UPI0025C04927|nr:KTSC domain-containing protein [Bradyrhizobium sp.]
MVRAATSLVLVLLSASIGVETVNVGDGGLHDVGSHECRDINRSTIVQRVCYDRARLHLIVGIQGSYSQYCELSVETFDAFMAAPSMGQFFRRNIGEQGTSGRYNCQSDRRPGP